MDDRPRHLCDSCVYRRPQPETCAVRAPAAAASARGELVPLCGHYHGRDGVQAVRESAPTCRSR